MEMHIPFLCYFYKVYFLDRTHRYFLLCTWKHLATLSPDHVWGLDYWAKDALSKKKKKKGLKSWIFLQTPKKPCEFWRIFMDYMERNISSSAELIPKFKDLSFTHFTVKSGFCGSNLVWWMSLAPFFSTRYRVLLFVCFGSFCDLWVW